MKKEELVQFYDGFAEKYDQEVLEGRDYTAFERMPPWILSRLKKGSLLDLGCGTGLGSRSFLENGFSVTGVDISPKMLECAARLPFTQLHCQSLEEPLPFPKNQFDAAQMLGVMEFIQNPKALFEEVARVLKPKGLFGFTVPEKLSLEEEKKVEILTHYPEEIERLAQEEGFTVVIKEQFPGFICKGIEVRYTGYLLGKK